MTVTDAELVALVGMVRAEAGRLAYRAHPPFTFEDLVSAGFEGLVVARERFADQVGCFGAFARVTVRGAMTDALRREARQTGYTVRRPLWPWTADLVRCHASPSRAHCRECGSAVAPYKRWCPDCWAARRHAQRQAWNRRYYLGHRTTLQAAQRARREAA